MMVCMMVLTKTYCLMRFLKEKIHVFAWIIGIWIILFKKAFFWFLTELSIKKLMGCITKNWTKN
jgi:hypothetical protein